jgi:hypothetical protein
MTACCKMDSESTKNMKLLCVSWTTIKFFAGRKGIAVAGVSSCEWVGGVRCRRPTRFPDMCSRSRTSAGSEFEARVVEVSSCRCGSPGRLRKWAIGGCRTWRRLAAEGLETRISQAPLSNLP